MEVGVGESVDRRWVAPLVTLVPGGVAVDAYGSSMVDATGIDTTALDASTAEESSSLAVLQAVADPVRWTIIHTLAARPSCVCNLQEHVPIAANLLSYHLKVLREAGLVTSEKRGRWVDYALAPDASARMRAALPDVLNGPVACATTDAAAGPLSR